MGMFHRRGARRRDAAVRVIAGVAVACGLLASGPARAAEPSAFPVKPITIVVYTAPGGLIDVTARKFAAVASSYSDAVFVVENLAGAGGLLAMKSVLRRPADGYTLFACTRSNVPTLVAARGDAYIDALEWLALLVVDPECVIVKRGAAINSWSTLMVDARDRPGQQLWLGPDQGGLDHVVAAKLWEQAGIQARWVPFKSGDKAILALLGEQGVAYVGNPSDIVNQSDLVMAAVSSPARLPAFPDVPTFAELGVGGMDAEVMWRGFAVRRGVPSAALDWYATLFQQVTDDQDWRAFWERSAIAPVYQGPEAFGRQVHRDRDDFAHQLARMGMVTAASTGWRAWSSGPAGLWIFGMTLVALAGALMLLARRGAGCTASPGALWIPLALLFTSATLAALTLTFPAEAGSVSTVVPRLWSLLLALLSVAVLALEWRHPAPASPSVALAAALRMVALTVLFVVILQVCGYALSTFCFLLAGMLMLGYTRRGVALTVTLLWTAGSWWLFVRVLYVPLPSGWLWARVFGI